MNLNPALAAVVAALTPVLPEFRSVAAHGGAFGERELALWLSAAPCARVALLGLNAVAPRGRDGWRADARWAVYLLTTDQPGENRLALALDGVDRLTAHLVGGPTWGLTCNPPRLETIQAENLYSGPVNTLSVALWAVAWTQTHHHESGVRSQE